MKDTLCRNVALLVVTRSYYYKLTYTYRMDWLKTRHPRIQMSAWVGTTVPHRRTLLTSWSRGSTATVIGLVFVTDCPPNSTLHCWLLSLPGRRCSCLAQSATARHFCAFFSRLCISAENPLLLFSVSFPEQFWMYSVLLCIYASVIW